MSERTFYCFCDANCKHETMTKEQILAAITQAASGEPVIDPDAGVLTKVKETNNGGYITFWVGTQAQYNALQGNTVQNCVYIITDEAAKEDINTALQQLDDRMKTVETVIEGSWDKTEAKTVTKNGGFTKKYGGSNVTIDEASQGRYQYMPALGKANLVANIGIRGTMAKGETMSLNLQTGAYKRVSIVIPDALSVYCSNPVYGRISAKMDTDGTICIRAEDGFTVNGQFDWVNLQGLYPCDGEVV